MKNAPATPKKKRYLHVFYLLQPALQFFALALAILALSRCSPLAPSTDKGMISSSAKGLPIGAETPNDNVSNLISENTIQNSLKEIAVADLKVLEEKGFEDGSKESLGANPQETLSERRVLERFERKHAVSNFFSPSGNSGALITLRLSKEKQSALLREEFVRIEMTKSLLLDTPAKKALALQLRKEHQSLNLDAAAYAVLPKERLRQEYAHINLRLKVSLAVIDENSIVLELRRAPLEEGHNADELATLDAVFNDAKHIAVVLE